MKGVLNPLAFRMKLPKTAQMEFRYELQREIRRGSNRLKIDYRKRWKKADAWQDRPIIAQNINNL